jgi:hypothetical protein
VFRSTSVPSLVRIGELLPDVDVIMAPPSVPTQQNTSQPSSSQFLAVNSAKAHFGDIPKAEIRFGSGPRGIGTLDTNSPRIYAGFPFNPPITTVSGNSTTQATQTELTGENPGVNRVFLVSTLEDQNSKKKSPRYAQTYYSGGGAINPSNLRQSNPYLINK